MWVLIGCYDIALSSPTLQSPLHKYQSSNFKRTTDPAGARSHFFGFQSFQKTLSMNILRVALACIVMWLVGPRTGLVRAIYNNTALTTAALVLAFLTADFLGPSLLIRGICVLSAFREAVVFFRRQVRT